MKITLDRKWIGILLLFQVSLVMAAFSGGMLVDRWLQPGQKQFPVLREAHNVLLEHALIDLPADPALEYGMIRGMVEAVHDPHTTFVEPSQHELQSQQLAGRFGGIGARLELSIDGFYVVYPYPGSPAEKAGIQPGDRLLQVDELEINAQTPQDVVEAALRGPEGQKVTLVVARSPGYEPKSISVRRADQPLPSVSWNLAEEDPRVGVIHVNVVADTTVKEIQAAVKELQSGGATHFILDLRNNFGGLVEAGVDTARLFLKSGVVIEQQYRSQPLKTFTVQKTGPLADLPLVVLVNGNTASAAEIIAGSLQAQDRAILIGSPTYGKNTIQLVFDLQDKSSLHVTAARWWVPGDELRSERKGFQPDILVPDDQNHTPALMQAALKSLLQ